MSRSSVPLEALNARTQPPQRFRVFNRGDVLPRAWYFACKSRELPRGGVRSLTLGNQRLVLFRGEDGVVGCLDAFCPHMGTDLALGKVQGSHLRCAFHHWRFAKDGACVRRPCDAPGEEAQASRVRTRAWAVTERYEALWVFPDSTPDVPLLELRGIEGKPHVVAFDALNTSNSPYHVSMVNGLDMQHLSTIHDLEVQLSVEIEEDAHQFDAVVSGTLPGTGAFGAIFRALVGPRYGYAMRYAHATVAGLTLLMHTRWPELSMIFAYRPLEGGRSLTQPIFVAERRPGALGWLRARLLLLATRVAYRFLEEEDERIYDHIRFTARSLVVQDAPVARYIRWVESLVPSEWSAPGGEAVPEDAGSAQRKPFG